MVSLDGSTPNTMLGDLDMNSFDILNVGQIDIATLTVQQININDYINSTGLATDINGLSLNQGDILYYDGSNIVVLPIGSTGKVLKVVGGIPAWATETDTDTIGITIEEDGSEILQNTVILNFVTGGLGVVTSSVAGEVTVDLTGV
jgi:hypothetical protein